LWVLKYGGRQEMMCKECHKEMLFDERIGNTRWYDCLECGAHVGVSDQESQGEKAE
jgi:DNA-directed RNA polymerase subunit RPC12/RpoP